MTKLASTRAEGSLQAANCSGPFGVAEGAKGFNMSSAACDICYEDYDSHEVVHRPRTLPCGHTIAWVSAGSVAGAQECQHVGMCRSAEICCAIGRLLQLASPSRNCPTCRRSVDSTDPESYPRNYALEAALDSVRDRFFADTAESELDASNLRITEEILGEGGTGMVKAGELRLGQVNIKVSRCAAVRLHNKFSDIIAHAGCRQNASYTGG